MALPFPILTADEAAALIQDGQTIGFSGFTPAGAAKAIPLALAARAQREHAAGRPFKVGVLTGASTGPSLDGALAEAEAISFRTPYQSDSTLRKQINAGKVRFVDMHLSLLPQNVRYGFLGPVHWAVVEACDVTPGGGIVLTTSVGASNTYLRLADKILIELNARHPAALLGIHDIFEPAGPAGAAGDPHLQRLRPHRLAHVHGRSEEDRRRRADRPRRRDRRLRRADRRHRPDRPERGRVPGRGDAGGPHPAGSSCRSSRASATSPTRCWRALGKNPDIPAFEMYTEVLQDSVVPLLENGRCTFASTCALTLSPAAMQQGLLRTSTSSGRGSCCARRRSPTTRRSSAASASSR